MPKLMMLPVEERNHDLSCPACQGRGVTGVQYQMKPGGGDVVLLVDVICPECGGCGNGHPEHPGCRDEWHAEDPDADEPGYDDSEDPDDECDGGPACWSCRSGRGWNTVLGFAGEGPDTVMYLLRMPCGCAESRMVEAAEDA